MNFLASFLLPSSMSLSDILLKFSIGGKIERLGTFRYLQGNGAGVSAYGQSLFSFFPSSALRFFVHSYTDRKNDLILIMTPEKKDKTLELSKRWSPDSTPARKGSHFFLVEMFIRYRTITFLTKISVCNVNHSTFYFTLIIIVIKTAEIYLTAYVVNL